jgi:chloramphenicol-sensitive protein RarD
MPDIRTPDEERAWRRGLLYGVLAYGSWGFMPVYIKAVRTAPILEVLSHRVFWAFLLLLALCWKRGELGTIRAAVRTPRTLALLAGSTAAIAVNWLAYIWAVANGHVLESSLGYFINPLVNVLFGVLILGETLDRPVRIAVGVAAVGVLWMAVRAGHVPWISLTLATSFGLYGLLRKLAPVGGLAGLTIETALLSPLAGGYIAWAVASGRSGFLAGRPWLDVLLLMAGPVTAVPLLFFAGAARRLPLSTLGMLQYLSPSLQFLLAVFAYREALDRPRLVAFVFIWTALAIFAIHTARRTRLPAGRIRQ